MAATIDLPLPLRPLVRFLGTPRGARIDAALVRRTGHSPYSYLYGLRRHRRWVRRAGPYKAPLALTTTGRRSGKRRTVALAYAAVPPHAGWSVVGSNGGNPREPQWVRNLRADPEAWVHLHRRTIAVRAEILEGDAKRTLWDATVTRAPVFATFQAAVERDIPIVVLRPRS
jgi:deazaflavin-dependent oxidoreductase (nitroreductase family)